MSQYAKYIAALVGTVLSALVGALTDNVITDTDGSTLRSLESAP